MGDDPIACRADSRSAVTESFRALRTNLQYLLAKEGANVILVSSLHPQEGKSFVSANLASILAKAGKKVALVDFDMHKPRVHTYMGLANERGASSLMIGKASQKDIMKPGAYPSMHVLTAACAAQRVGPHFERPHEGDGCGAQGRLRLRDFGHAPILLISDALVLMEHVDTALLVTNVAKSSRRGVQHLEDLLEQNGLKHASFVLNGVRTKRWATTTTATPPNTATPPTAPSTATATGTAGLSVTRTKTPKPEAHHVPWRAPRAIVVPASVLRHSHLHVSNPRRATPSL